MSIENKQISEEKLDNVSGGKYLNVTSDKSRYSDYNILVDKYHGVIGKTYLFVCSDFPENWYFGELYNSYEKDNGCYSYRRHDIIVKDAGGVFVDRGRLWVNDGGTYEIEGDSYMMLAKAGE